MIDTIDSIDLVYSSGRSCISQTPEAIQKVESGENANGRVSVRKLAIELRIYRTSIHRTLKQDLKCRNYKRRVQLFLTDAHKAERKAFANWIRTNFREEQIMRTLFSDEKNLDIDGIYNLQNDRAWTFSRSETNERGGIVGERKFPLRVMVWVDACSKSISP